MFMYDINMFQIQNVLKNGNFYDQKNEHAWNGPKAMGRHVTLSESKIFVIVNLPALMEMSCEISN